MILNTTLGGDYDEYRILEYGNVLALKKKSVGSHALYPLHKGTVERYEVFREDGMEVDLHLFMKDGTKTICMMDRKTFLRFQVAVDSEISSEKDNKGSVKVGKNEEAQQNISIITIVVGAGIAEYFIYKFFLN